MYPLGWFPVAALASCQKHGGLKQPKLIILLFYDSEVPSGSRWAKTNMLLGLRSFWKLGENPFSHLLQLLEAPTIPWLWLWSLPPSSNPARRGHTFSHPFTALPLPPSLTYRTLRGPPG